MKVSLKALRVNARLTQDDVAEKMSIAKMTLVKWENNVSSPKVYQLQKLCEIYGCNIDDVYFPDNHTTKSYQ